jgi:hypothetical protein
MHEPETPAISYYQSGLVRSCEGSLVPFRIHENVTHIPEVVVKNALTESQKNKEICSESTTCDKNLIANTAGFLEKTHDLINATPCSESNRDHDHATSPCINRTVTRPKLPSDHWIEVGSEDSRHHPIEGIKLRPRGGTISRTKGSDEIPLSEIVERATTDYLIDADFAWREHLSDAESNELVTRVVDSTIRDWSFDHGSDPCDVHKSTRILAHAVLLALGWRAREKSQILIADVMRDHGSVQHA